MKKLIFIILSLILINCEKDNGSQDDPIRASWLGEFDVENSDGDTVYFQIALKFNDDLLYTKAKSSINNIDTYEPEEQPVPWKNNDSNCKPADCANYDSVNQEYTIDGEIVRIVFTNDFNKFIINILYEDDLELERQAEDVFWNNF